ncbi:MAG: DUF5615 family PIN-like protein [Lewinellaceae bacterium]|nr:DUF5615 family PIN-like protein [Lewinellaceae bacterium]
MKFAVDEGVDARIVLYLRSQEHDVWYYAEEERGAADVDILKKAVENECVLVTRDKDFGELAYRDLMVHAGILLLRLEKLPSKLRVATTITFIEENLDRIPGNFIVLRPGAARIRPLIK